VVLTGEANSTFGTSTIKADLNSDGYADLVIGATRYNTFTGRVYIFLSPGSSGIAATSSPQTSANSVITGEVINSTFGSSVAVGDFNLDGYPDLVVNAASYSTSTGRLYIYNSSANGISSRTANVSTDTTITGEGTTHVFGYVFESTGDSMIDEGIFDGDIVIIKKQSVAENRQTVVAIIDDNQATLKKIYREKSRFRLEPRNQNLLPFFRKEVEIRGVVVQVIRNINNKEIIPVVKKSDHGFKTIDLFAGVGGIRLGFEKAGFETVFANDFEPRCKETYDLNFSTSKLIVEDIRKIGIDDLPKFDFLLGGFPCQAFSIAGYRQGFGDEKGRGNLFFDIARILKERKPEGFLLENVKNLKSHDGGKTFKIIEDALKDLGYHIKVKVLNTMEYGNVPQNRERIYIVGFKNKLYSDRFEFPNPVKLTKKITDLLEKNVPEKYYYNGKPLFEKLKNSIKEEDKVYQWRRQYVRENKSGVCPTLTANMGMGGHNVPIIKDKKGIRKLTPLECFRIQGFPKDYVLPKISDSSLYKQAGNSVSVPVVEAVAKQMMRAMK
jgi:DNA (cytosine-5)-methyltransferase 1